MNKVLLLGGTGAIGSYLKDILAQHDVETFVTSRSKHDANCGVLHYIQGDAHDEVFLTKICATHYDAIVDFMSYKTDEFSNRVKTLLNSTDQYVFISSSRVYADKLHPIKESAPRLLDVSENEEYLNTDEYALTKARQENMLIENEKKNYTIVRPYITYGDYRLQLGVLEKEEWLYRALKGRTVVFSDEIAQKITTMTYGYDVAFGIYNLFGNSNSLGETYHITCNQLMRWRDVWAIYSKTLESATGRSVKLKLVDNEIFMATRSENLKWQVIYDRLYDRDFDTTKTEKIMDVASFVTPEIGLVKCISNFLSNPIFKNINWKSEAFRDKITRERTPITEIIGFKNKLIYIYYRYKI